MRQAKINTRGKPSRRRAITLLGVELGVAMALTLAGIILLFVGFYSAPRGEIHSSVLVAYGEVMTFAGGLFGIDYHRRRLFWVAHREGRAGEPSEP